MLCPLCGVSLQRRVERVLGPVKKRKRECPKCLTEFETTERIDYDKLPRYILDKLHEKAERTRV